MRAISGEFSGKKKIIERKTKKKRGEEIVGEELLERNPETSDCNLITSHSHREQKRRPFVDLQPHTNSGDGFWLELVGTREKQRGE